MSVLADGSVPSHSKVVLPSHEKQMRQSTVLTMYNPSLANKDGIETYQQQSQHKIVHSKRPSPLRIVRCQPPDPHLPQQQLQQTPRVHRSTSHAIATPLKHYSTNLTRVNSPSANDSNMVQTHHLIAKAQDSFSACQSNQLDSTVGGTTRRSSSNQIELISTLGAHASRAIQASVEASFRSSALTERTPLPAITLHPTTAIYQTVKKQGTQKQRESTAFEDGEVTNRHHRQSQAEETPAVQRLSQKALPLQAQGIAMQNSVLSELENSSVLIEDHHHHNLQTGNSPRILVSKSGQSSPRHLYHYHQQQQQLHQTSGVPDSSSPRATTSHSNKYSSPWRKRTNVNWQQFVISREMVAAAIEKIRNTANQSGGSSMIKAQVVVRLFQEDISEYSAYVEQVQWTIFRRDSDSVVEESSKFLRALVLRNEVGLFLSVVEFLGRYFFDLQEYSKSIFFLNEGRLLCDMTQHYRRKIDFLQALAKNSNRICRYDQAIILLKKALQYAWYCNLAEREIELYDELGISNYYLGNIRNSQIYHDKFVVAEREPSGSPDKWLSVNDLEFFMRRNQQRREEDGDGGSAQKMFAARAGGTVFGSLESSSKLPNFTRLMIVKLSLPMRNPFQNDQRCDRYRDVNYQHCNGAAIVENIVREEEFYFRLQTPKQSKWEQRDDQLAKGALDHGAIVNKKKKNIDSKARAEYIKVVVPKLEVNRRTRSNKLSSMHQYDPSVYKVSLDELIKARQKKTYDLEQIVSRIRGSISFGRNNNEVKTQTYLKHQGDDIIREERNKNDGQRLRTKYHDFFVRAIALDLIEKFTVNSGQSNI